MEAQILELLAQKPMSYRDVQRALRVDKDTCRTVLAEMKAKNLVMYNQTDKVLELYRVAMF